MDKHFREILADRQKFLGSALCVGLDPIPEQAPKKFWYDSMHPRADRVADWMIEIVDTTVPYASMYKPQSAYWEAMPEGREAMWKVIDHIHHHHPYIPVFLDCKRGDIGRTQEQYGIAHFDLDEVDGMNFSPYMGKDCFTGLLDPKHPERAIVSLAYTSNPAARQMQDVLMANGRPYWEHVVRCVMEWATETKTQNVGLVMAAAYEYPKGSGSVYSAHLSRVREIAGDMFWLLIPGIGTQKGFLRETLRAAWSGPGCLAINSSSGICMASKEDDYAEAAGTEAKRLHNEMRDEILLLAQ